MVHEVADCGCDSPACEALPTHRIPNPDPLGFIIICGECGRARSWTNNDLLDEKETRQQLARDLHDGDDTRSDVRLSELPAATCSCQPRVAR